MMSAARGKAEVRAAGGEVDGFVAVIDAGAREGGDEEGGGYTGEPRLEAFHGSWRLGGILPL